MELGIARSTVMTETEEIALPSGSPLLDLIEESRKDYEQTRKELKEIEVLIHQSSAEVDKLVQRNSQITTKVHQMEANIDTYPRQDIKEVYSAAKEAQTRLFMMRGQLEQLQSKQQNLEKYAEHLQKFLEVSEQVAYTGPSAEGSAPAGERTIVRIIEAQESERLHLARRMHDEPAQALTNLILQAEICERLFETDPARARIELGNLKNAVNATFQKTREFIFDLRPMMLDDLGLIPTLKRYVLGFEEKSGLSTNLTIVGKERRLPPHTEVTIFRVVQGLLKNISQHANATHVQVSVNLEGGAIGVSVEDDGSGFDVDDAVASARQRKTLGIAAMQEQVGMLGGQINFESGIGRGTKVKLEIPI
jgi:two-component system sensor histidine kinase DegS